MQGQPRATAPFFYAKDDADKHLFANPVLQSTTNMSYKSIYCIFFQKIVQKESHHVHYSKTNSLTL